MRPLRFSSIVDVAREIHDSLFCGAPHAPTVKDVQHAIPRQSFGRYEDIDDPTRERLCRAVWAELIGGDYPFEPDAQYRRKTGAMTNLHLADTLTLPADSAARSFAILGMRGAGKSNAAVVLAEALHSAGTPWLCIDPKGDWFGLRSSSNGTAPGLPVLILGGEHHRRLCRTVQRLRRLRVAPLPCWWLRRKAAAAGLRQGWCSTPRSKQTPRNAID
jgi:hypothetical protein